MSARGFLAVARRELQEKWFVFPAAAVTGLVPFAIPLLRGLHGAHAVEVRDWTALIGAASFAAGLAIVLGWSTIASDLAERRLGFYFSRPISGLSLWGGKLGAAWLLAISAATITFLPTFVVNGGSVALDSFGRAPLKQAPVLFLAGMAALVLILHAAGILVRTRSPLLAVDAAALILLAFVVVVVLQKLSLLPAVGPWAIAVITLIATTVVACGAAGLSAVTSGRSDASVAHRALSVTLWGILGAGVAATSFYAAWVRSAGPLDLERIDWIVPGGGGGWVTLQGAARGWEPTFLYDTATGRFHRARTSWLGPDVSPDGRKAVWLEASKRGGPYDVMTCRLDEPAAKPVSIFSLPNVPYAAFLAEHGERLATIAHGVLSIWDSQTGASLGSVHLAEDRDGLNAFFAGKDRIRVLRFTNRWAQFAENKLDILDFDLSTRTLSTTLTIEDASACVEDETGDRLLVTGKALLRLHDGHTGALIASLAERNPQRRANGRFVSDGHIVVAVTEGASLGASALEARARRAHVEVFTHDGRPERRLALPAFESLSLGGEVAPGQLVLDASREVLGKTSHTVWLADLATGSAKQVAEGLSPIRTLSEPGSEATRLFLAAHGSLVRFDPLTGERRVLLGKK